VVADLPGVEEEDPDLVYADDFGAVVARCGVFPLLLHLSDPISGNVRVGGRSR
jgi:hypothetical protein